MAHGAVPLDSAHHEVLDIHHAGTAGCHGDHVVALAGQVVTRHEWGLLALGKRGGVAGQGWWEEQEEEQEKTPRRGGGGRGGGGGGVEHRRTDCREEKLSTKRGQFTSDFIGIMNLPKPEAANIISRFFLSHFFKNLPRLQLFLDCLF